MADGNKRLGTLAWNTWPMDPLLKSEIRMYEILGNLGKLGSQELDDWMIKVPCQ